MASMVMNDLGPMLTASEVADMLHLHVNTVKRLGDRGELPFYRVCKRGDRRFRLEDGMAFLARNRYERTRDVLTGRPRRIEGARLGPFRMSATVNASAAERALEGGQGLL